MSIYTSYTGVAGHPYEPANSNYHHTGDSRHHYNYSGNQHHGHGHNTPYHNGGYNYIWNGVGQPWDGRGWPINGTLSRGTGWFNGEFGQFWGNNWPWTSGHRRRR